MKFIKNLTIGTLSALVTIILGYGGYTIHAESADVKDYLYFADAGSSFEDIQGNYHIAMNSYFNDKLDLLVELLDEEDFYENENFNAPADNQCPAENVSTYCVSMGALELYINYIETLNQIKGYLPTGELADKETITQEDILLTTQSRNLAIASEVEDAKAVLEGTVAVYDEFRLAYPMHQKYEVITKNLIKYKLSLGKITREVNSFPLKFIDATSAQCK
jgi:hypothetical protein